MDRIAAKWAVLKYEVRSDENLTRARHGIVRGVRALPSATGHYFIQKVPVVKWLPKYKPIWIVNDAVAGITVGLLLVPQALAYASLAGIPLQDGLLASWLPSAIYVIMGTSKDISTGPTSTIGLLTGQIILFFGQHEVPPFVTAAAVAFSVGIMSLIMGLLKLGWLLDFVSLPVLTGFIMGAALVIIQGQVPDILGETGVSSQFIHQGIDIVTKLNTAQPLTIAIGISGIALLLILQFIGRKWGKRYAPIRILGISRNAIVLILYTGISFAVNKDKEIPLWAITGVVPRGLQEPKIPPLRLVKFVIYFSFPVFIATALEHIAIAKSVGRRNGYTIDESQELVFLGVTNLLNGIFGGMPVGGAISRTSVNSESGVKSPLGGMFTTAVVLLGIFSLNGAIFWIPKATLAAVIIMAVINILPPVSVQYKYWKTSFADFVASTIALNLTLLKSAENGIGLGVLFMIIYTLLRTAFTRAKPITRTDLENQYGSDPTAGSGLNRIPSGTQVMSFNQAIIFLNAYRLKRDIMDTVQTYHTGTPVSEKRSERSWSDLGEKRIVSLRHRANISMPSKLLPRIRVLVLDFSHVGFIDTTGLQMLMDMRADLRSYGGEDVELRFVGLIAPLKKKFERVGWELATDEEALRGLGEGKDVVYELLKPAIEAPRIVSDSGLDFGFGNVLLGDGASTWSVEEDLKKNVIVTQVSMKGGKPYKG